MNMLEGKKILFFAPKFFNYDVAIKEEMERQGAEVHLYDERNNPTSIQKICLRKFHFLMTKSINKYYKMVTDIEMYFNPDFILFISPETVNQKSIMYMRSVFVKSRFILYMWDSIENKNAKHIYKYFDKCYSFDTNDCAKYKFIFRPLFFMKEFENNNNKTKTKYDFSFIGSIHSDRATILDQLKRFFEDNHLSFYYYLYVPGRLMYFIYNMLDKHFRKLKKEYVHLRTLSKQEVSTILSETNYVIDINHPKQIGLTMRTIEMIGSQNKIVTTNGFVKDYDFYNPSNQLIINRDNIFIDKQLLIDGYNTIPKNIYNKYKLSEWVREIMN